MTELLQMNNVSKTFSGVTVLSGVDLTVRQGEIHALLGQNGSGKSTLIKILSGYHPPDEGARMQVRGEDIPLPLNPGDPLKFGIAFVHQDLGLAEELSLVDNLSVGEYRLNRGWRIDWRKQEQAVAASLREFGVEEDVRNDVSTLSSPAKRALVAIARAVTHIRRHHGGGVLVLDEPTVYLPRNEVRHLQDVVRRLAADGVGVLYVTHRLDELRDFADRATVLRDGRRVGVVDVRSEGTSGLVQLITGTAVDFGEAREADVNLTAGEVLTVKGLSGGRVTDVSFSVRPGEVVGLAGLVGMGQDDVLGLVFGATRRTAGEVIVDGARLPGDPRRAIDHGVSFLPADRPKRSAAMAETVADNVTLPILRKTFFSSGRVQTRQERQHVTALLERFDVRPRSPLLEIARLSGGNQQKALLAKWLQTEPRVLLLDEPVQGVDIGAKAQIFERLRDTAAAGCSLVIASSEYEDLALLCDRVLILVDGRVDRVLTGPQVTKDQIAAACYGAGGV
jgi:ribose transport system ATP-binding protein